MSDRIDTTEGEAMLSIQPSARTAEPRTHHDPNTAAGRLEVFIRANANRGGMNDLAGWLSDLDKIVAEAAAPAELDVEALALVFAGITFSEWADAQGDTTRLFDLTRHVAAEYDHLLRQRGER